MGCDIHSVVQVHQGRGRWLTVLRNAAGDVRSYDTFAVLAGVRNGEGFAGIPTGDPVEPIEEPRGYPAGFDVQDDTHHFGLGIPSASGYEVKTDVEMWMGDHSHSWLLLSEIEDYIARTKGTRRKRGIVPAEDYERFRETNAKPEQWSLDISGPGIIVLTALEYDKLQARGWLPKGKRIYVDYTWHVDALELTCIPQLVIALAAIAREHNVTSDEVRIVFGFDS